LQVEHNQAKHATPVGLQSKTAAKNREANTRHVKPEKKTTKGHTHRDRDREGDEEEGGVKWKRGEETGSVAEVSSSYGGKGATATQCEKAAGSTHSTKTTNSPGHTDA
jgi:hypothetical protein